MAKNNQAVKVVAPEVPEVAAPEVVTYDLEALMTQYKTKSNVIRFLTTQGKTRSEIAKFMNIRYQHVRNVLIQPLKQPVPVVMVTEPETEESA